MLLGAGMAAGLWLGGRTAAVPDQSHHADAPAPAVVAGTDLHAAAESHDQGDHAQSPAAHEHAEPASPDQAHGRAAPHGAPAVAHSDHAVPAAPPGRQPAARVPPPSDPLALRPPTDDVFVEVDELISEGNFAMAHDECARILRGASGLHEARGRFRLALCEETLGNLSRAQEEYRRVVELQAGPQLREAALLGQARVWELTGHRDAALQILYRALLEDLRHIPDSTRSQLPHQLAAAAAARVQPEGVNSNLAADPLREDFLASPVLTVRPDQILEDLGGRDRSAPVQPASSPLELTVVSRFSDSPDEIFLNVRTDRLSALELIQLAASVSGWSVRFSDDARLQLQERTFAPHCLNLSLGLLLDGILEQFDLTWRRDAEALVIYPVDHASSGELRTARYDAARRSLKMAAAVAPVHRWAATSALELGRVQAVAGQQDDGLRDISRAIEHFPRSPEISLGWFNLGKLHLRRGDLPRSLISFRRAMDMLGGHPFEAAAYLHVGRIMLEQDAPRDAILPLTRAVSLSPEGPQMGTSATLLASAYLMLEHYQRANDILLEQRASLSSGEIVDVAAFLASLIRFRAAPDQIERQRQGAMLLCSMTNLKPENCFGGHWSYLAGMAYRDTGMIPDELAVFQKALETGYNYPLQRRMRMALLEDAPPGTVPAIPLRDETPAARQESQPVRLQALLARATLASRQGDDALAMEHCRELLADPEAPAESRREALRIMGHVYQLRGDHQRAVDCFTGVVPTEEEAPEENRSRAEAPSRRRTYR